MAPSLSRLLTHTPDKRRHPRRPYFAAAPSLVAARGRRLRVWRHRRVRAVKTAAGAAVSPPTVPSSRHRYSRELTARRLALRARPRGALRAPAASRGRRRRRAAGASGVAFRASCMPSGCMAFGVRAAERARVRVALCRAQLRLRGAVPLAEPAFMEVPANQNKAWYMHMYVNVRRTSPRPLYESKRPPSYLAAPMWQEVQNR